MSKPHTIDILKQRGLIGPDHFEAATRFFRDTEMATRPSVIGFQPQERVDVSTISNTPSLRIDAERRVQNALAAINTVSRLLILDVIGEGLSLAEVTRKRGFPAHYAGPRLREALEELASHYSRQKN